jgi:hypothetical protein
MILSEIIIKQNYLNLIYELKKLDILLNEEFLVHEKI